MTPEERLAALSAGRERGEGSITLHRRGPHARVVIDNPRARNALTIHMMQDLAAIVRTLERWDGATVSLESADSRAFCSGGHLRDVQASLFSPSAGGEMARAMSEVLDRFLGLPMVSVALVMGPAVGGGAELCTACDFRLFGPSGRMQFVQARLGVALGWGGMRRLVALVGRRRALLLATGRSCGGVEATDWGLADGLVEDAHELDAFLQPFHQLPVEALRAVKGQVVSETREERVAWFESVWGGGAHRRALERTRK